MKKLSTEAEEIVYRTRRRVEAIECDICSRLITPTKFRDPASQYFKVTTGHYDWGNDSCDSVEHFDICPGCIGDFVTKYTKEISYTGYLELENDNISTSDYEYI